MQPGQALRGLARPFRSVAARVNDHLVRAKLDALYRKGEAARPGERVLFWIPGGMPLMLEVEGVIAAALKLRGVDVHAVLCDGPFAACIKRELVDELPMERWHETCSACTAATSRKLDLIGIPYSYIGDFVSSDTRSSLRRLASQATLDDLDAIEIAGPVKSSVTRFLRGAPLTGHEELVREYTFSALVCASAAEAAVHRLQPSRIFMSHGVDVDWGPALAVALRLGVPVCGWMASYLDTHFYFRHVDDPLRIDFHNMSSEAWREQELSPISVAQDAALTRYLTNRYMRKISFDMRGIPDFSGDTETFRRRYFPMSDKPVWGIMAHINWDFAAAFAPMTHRTFDEWIMDTIEQIGGIADVNWLLKIHPSEAFENPDHGVQRLIDAHFPTLPSNVRVIPAEEQISPLDFYDLVDGGVTVYGTPGLELALLGKPVILAGEAHFSGKGFTYDGITIDGYHDLLRRASEFGPLSSEQRLRAKKYAYTYFIRRQVPLRVLYDPNSWWTFPFRRPEALLPGNDPFVDFVCHRILDGRDFVMDDRLVAAAHASSSVGDDS